MKSKEEGYSHPLLVDPIMAPSNLPQDHLLRRGSSVLPPPTHHRLLIVSQLLQKRSEKQAERRKIRRASLSYLATTYKLAVSFAPRIVAWVHLRLPRPMCGVLFLLFALHWSPMSAQVLPEHICYVHCNFCNTVLAVSIILNSPLFSPLLSSVSSQFVPVNFLDSIQVLIISRRLVLLSYKSLNPELKEVCRMAWVLSDS